MRRLFRVVSIFIVFHLPGAIRYELFKWWLGWDIHSSVRIGISIVDAKHVSMKRNSRIGHFNTIRNLNKLIVGENATVGQWNWISAAPTLITVSEGGVLTVGAHSAIVSRHYLDCSGNIHIGSFTTIAGIRSTIISHQIDITNNRQTVLPVSIGNYCFVGSDVRITPGTTIVDRCVIAMGGVVVKDLEQSDCLYGGVPARLVKQFEDAAYFQRSIGRVA